jgi:hypothetical protein
MNAFAPAQTLSGAVATDVEQATALFNESLTYLRLASDHAKFIRNFFDPTQERLFRMADDLAVRLDQLRAELCRLQEPVAPAEMFAFVGRAAPVITQLIGFKRAVADLVRICGTQQLLPADFIDHLRREAEFFLGIVSHVLGAPSPTNQQLDLPGPATARVATIARKLIDQVPLAEVLAADLAYTEFWGKHHFEHADALMKFLRPEQTDLIQGASRFRTNFQNLLSEAVDVENAPTLLRFDDLDRQTLSLSMDWRNFLINAEQAQRTCTLQTNFPQRLTEHIRIETDILLEAVGRSAGRRRKPGGAPIVSAPVTGATFQSLTPKSILCR